ncbi:hypothetical protein ACIPW5_06470 [Streptomyces sp. NPDC090077]|uniref:hypothetical protein n=1 Tax=Streptomyces sp. NPDC090077 TaxID=3365938 RepID=UPI0038025048
MTPSTATSRRRLRAASARPEDIARVIATPLSDDGGWITAQDIEVSGGCAL